MRSFTAIILHAFVAQAHATELVTNHTDDTQNVMDNLADKLVGRFVDRAMALVTHHTDLDSSTLGKIHPDRSLGTSYAMTSRPAVAPFHPSSMVATPVQAVQDKLKMYGIGSSPLEKLALSAIDAVNRGTGMRDVSVMAANMDEATKEEVSEIGEAVTKAAKRWTAEDMAGITPPLGFFDPLGFSTLLPEGNRDPDADGTTEGRILFYREVELKHGRVGMLAALGFLVGEQFHPLFGGNIDVPSYVAFQQTPLQQFWPAVVAAIAIPEVFSVFTFEDAAQGEGWSMKKDRVPGDLGFDPLGLKPTDPKEFLEMQNKELNNGRLAMIAAAGMIAQELATGKKLF